MTVGEKSLYRAASELKWIVSMGSCLLLVNEYCVWFLWGAYWEMIERSHVCPTNLEK